MSEGKRGKKRFVVIRILVLIFFLVCVLVGFLLYLRILDCDQNCKFVYNKSLEGYVNEIQSNVTRVSIPGGTGQPDGVRFSMKGFLNEVVHQDGKYVLKFNNYFNNIKVGDSVPSYLCPIPEGLCQGQCRDKIDNLVARRRNLEFNELTTVSLEYRMRELTFIERIKLAGMELKATFLDYSVDVSSFGALNFEYYIKGASEIRESCTNSVSTGNVVKLGEQMHSGLLEVFENSSIKTNFGETPEGGDTTGRLMKYGTYSCYSCTGKCELYETWGIGIDYVFFPMFVSLLEEKGGNINPGIALDVLSRSYGADPFPSFDDFVSSSANALDLPKRYMWGTESVCSPYYMATRLGKTTGTFYDVSQKICTGRAENVKSWGYFTDAQYEMVSDYSDEALFQGLSLLFENFDEFKSSALVEGHDSGFAKMVRVMDDYMYGYMFDDERAADYILVANEGLMMGAWKFVEAYERDGETNSFPNEDKFRDLVIALLLKKQLADDPVVDSGVDKAIADLLSFVGDSNYIAAVFNMSESESLPKLDAQESMRNSLGDLLRLWVIDSDFYSRYIDTTWQEYTGEWFIQHYMSEACGKLDKGTFVMYDSDGTCIKESFGVRANAATMIYLLLLN